MGMKITIKPSLPWQALSRISEWCCKASLMLQKRKERPLWTPEGFSSLWVMWGFWSSLATPHFYPCSSSNHLLWLSFLAFWTMMFRQVLYIYLFYFFLLPFPSVFRRWCLENWSLGDALRLPGQVFPCNDLAASRHKTCSYSFFSTSLVACKRKENLFFELFIYI